jgi:hypothetical protein
MREVGDTKTKWVVQTSFNKTVFTADDRQWCFFKMMVFKLCFMGFYRYIAIELSRAKWF